MFWVIWEKFPYVKYRRRAVAAIAEICIDNSSVPMKVGELKFWLP
jgi:hypothetical protein